MINSLCERLQNLSDKWQLSPLYGDCRWQSSSEQSHCQPGLQKIVVATNIAETSLTIEGINLVIDSGLVNQYDFHLRSGHGRVAIKASSQASSTSAVAEQVDWGRVNHAVWSKETHHRRRSQTEAAIHREDITDIVLEAAVWALNSRHCHCLNSRVKLK